jgi:HSP20 family protein
MVLFLQSHAAAIVALLVSMATSDAAYYGPLYMRSRPSMALGSRMLPAVSSPSFFSRDMRRVINEFDEMFDMLGVDEMFYDPLPLSTISVPSYFIPERRARNALVQNKATGKSLARDAFGITQDDKQLQMVVNVPGAKARDINLELADDGRVLRISGESKRENEGISVHSKFERSFALPRSVIKDAITAKIEDGVLTITAPKYEKEKERIHRIAIEENTEAKEDVMTAKAEEDLPPPTEKEGGNEVNTVPDESVIDLDVQKE